MVCYKRPFENPKMIDVVCRAQIEEEEEEEEEESFVKADAVNEEEGG